ncbi:MAG: hypothetical protein N2746_02435 [Deltaproteobacteria bacterium]|nr:hypothetical protein [Deltaproteobacteria bacterium]
MRLVILCLIAVSVLSCYGSDSEVVKIQLRIPLEAKQQGDSFDGIVSNEFSIDNFFAVARVVVKGLRSGDQSFNLVIRYVDAERENYYFEALVEAYVGDKLSVSFGGYYSIDKSSIGGFVSNGEYMIDVHKGVKTEFTFESVEIPSSEVNVTVNDKKVSSIIFYDPVREIFLKTIDRSPVSNSYYLRVPEGRYNIYSVDANKNRVLLRESQEIKGASVNVEL